MEGGGEVGTRWEFRASTCVQLQLHVPLKKNMSQYVSFQGKQVKLKDSQLCTRIIGKVFGVYPDSVILVGDDGTVEVPDEQGNFTDLSSFTDYEVQGESAQSAQSSGSSQHAFVPISKRGKETVHRMVKAGKRWNPLSLTTRGKTSTSKPPGVTMADKRKVAWQKTIEICAFNDSFHLEKQMNYPLDLTPATANITSVSDILSADVFNGQGCVLLDVDNLKIPDSATTRGMHVPSCV